MRFYFSRVTLFLIVAQFFGSILMGQDPSSMPQRQLQAELTKLLDEGNYAGAIPYFDELKIRGQDDPDIDYEKIIYGSPMVFPSGYMQMYAKTMDKTYVGNAAEFCGSFVAKYPDHPDAIKLLQMQDTFLRMDQQWETAVKVIEKLLDPGQPFLKKIVEEGKRSDLLNLYLGRAQCYHTLQNWVKGEGAFKELLVKADDAKDEDKAAYAISCLTEMYVETKRVDEVFPLLPRLSADTPARYDLRLNLNLMKGGDQLKDQERFVEASLLYALTMTAEEVKNYYTLRLNALTAEKERLALYLNNPNLPERRLQILRDKDNALTMKLSTAKSHLAIAEKTASFTTNLSWSKARNFQDTKRFWESFWGFYWLYKDDPENDLAEDFIYAAFASANTVKFAEKSIELGEEYLAKDGWAKYRADVTNIMANAYRQEAESQAAIAESLQTAISTLDKEKASKAKQNSEEQYQRFFELCDRFLEKAPGDKYATSFINMMGSVYFKQKRFDQLLEKFAGYVAGVPNDKQGYINNKEFSEGPAMPSALYLSGISLLSTGKFEESKPLLAPIIGVYVQGLPLADGTLSNMDQDNESTDE